ncbi:MAG: hypothetical protein ACRDLN_03545 [Solirubrobacteraceae bacterium]
MSLTHAPDDRRRQRANRAYHRAAVRPKAIWEIPDAGHVGGLAARPREHPRRVARILDHALALSPARPSARR